MKTLKNLIVAMINATVLLIALCLFLAWQLSRSAENVVATFSQNIDVLAPVSAELRGLRDDLGDIAAVTEQGATEGAAALAARIDSFEARIADIQNRLQEISDTPERLMVTAIDHSSQRIADTVNNIVYDIAGCTSTDLAEQNKTIDQ